MLPKRKTHKYPCGTGRVARSPVMAGTLHGISSVGEGSDDPYDSLRRGSRRGDGATTRYSRDGAERGGAPGGDYAVCDPAPLVSHGTRGSGLPWDQSWSRSRFFRAPGQTRERRGIGSDAKGSGREVVGVSAPAPNYRQRLPHRNLPRLTAR